MDDRDPQSTIRNPKFVIAAVLLLFLCCTRHTVFDRIENGDYSMVGKGRYDRPTVFLDEGGEYRAQVLDIRRVIEKHFDLMPVITRQCFDVDRDLAFTFKYAVLDTAERCLVLRYFARTHSDPVLAGYEIFFAYDTAARQVVRIFAGEVPLE